MLAHVAVDKEVAADSNSRGFLQLHHSQSSCISRAPLCQEKSQLSWVYCSNYAIPEPSPSDRQGILILLQYHLHKLYALSIYHPARGFDLSSATITPGERHELLVSARAVLRLRQDDASIWSNWDLIVKPPLVSHCLLGVPLIISIYRW